MDGKHRAGIRRPLVAAALAIAMLGALAAPRLVAALSGPTFKAPRVKITSPVATTGVPQVLPGGTMKLAATGFEASKPIEFRFDAATLATATTNTAGTATAVVTVPTSVPGGFSAHVVVAKTAHQGASTPVNVGSDWSSAWNGANGYAAPNPWSTTAALDALRTYLPVVAVAPPTITPNGVAPSGNNYVATTPVVAAGGSLYFGTSLSLAAIDAATYAPRWFAGAQQNPSCPDSCAFFSVATANGVVYGGDALGGIHAFVAATGAELWTTSAPWTSTVTELQVLNGVVYANVGGGANANFGIVAVSAGDGSVLWQQQLTNRGMVAASGTVFVSYVDDTPSMGVRALNAVDGSVRWTTAIPSASSGEPPLPTRPSLGSGAVFVGTSDGTQAAVKATTGGIQWQTNLPGADFEAPAAVSGGRAYWHDATSIYARSATTGTELWTVAPASFAPGVMVSAGDRLWIGAASWDAGTGSSSPYNNRTADFPDARATTVASGLTYFLTLDGRIWATGIDPFPSQPWTPAPGPGGGGSGGA